MALPTSLNDRRWNSFVEDAEGNVAVRVKLQDADVTISGNVQVDVSAFQLTDGTQTDAYVFTQDQSLATVTEHWQGIGGYDETANAFRAFPIPTDDGAMPANPQFIPAGGEYRASVTTYADGDATVLQSDVNGHLKIGGYNTHGASVIARAIQTLWEAKDFDGSALPNAVTEGQAIRPAASLNGVLYNMVVTEDGAKTPVLVSSANQVAAPAFMAIGGEYNTTLPTYSNGTAAIAQFDNKGRLISTIELNDYTDDSDEFTVASSKGLAIMGIATNDAVDSGDVGALAMSTDRELHAKITSMGINATGLTQGVQDVATAGTAVQLNGGGSLAITDGHSVLLKAKTANTDMVYVGNSAVSSTNGYQLNPGEGVALQVDNVSDVYIDSEQNNEGVSWIVEITS